METASSSGGSSVPNLQLVAGLRLRRALPLLFSLFLWQLQQRSCGSLVMTFRPPCPSLGKHRPQPHNPGRWGGWEQEQAGAGVSQQLRWRWGSARMRQNMELVLPSFTCCAVTGRVTCHPPNAPAPSLTPRRRKLPWR